MMDVMQMIRMLRSNGNPMQTLTQLSKQNPMVGQVLRMTNGKTPEEMKNMAYRMAQERGVNLDEMAQSMGLKLPR